MVEQSDGTGASRTAFVEGGVTCICRRDLADELRRIYRSSPWAFDALSGQPGARIIRGRRTLVVASLAGTPVLAKRLYHGGALAPLTSDRFLSSRRLRTHLECTDFLASAGVTTPAPLFVSWRRHCGFVRGEIGVAFLAAAVDASAFLFPAGGTLPAGWRERVEAIAALVARLHRLGVLHGDLNLRNFLFSEGGRVMILDLDKVGRHRPPLGARQRGRNLARLERSIRKQAALAGAAGAELVIEALRERYRTRNG